MCVPCKCIKNVEEVLTAERGTILQTPNDVFLAISLSSLLVFHFSSPSAKINMFLPLAERSCHAPTSVGRLWHVQQLTAVRTIASVNAVLGPLIPPHKCNKMLRVLSEGSVPSVDKELKGQRPQ